MYEKREKYLSGISQFREKTLLAFIAVFCLGNWFLQIFESQSHSFSILAEIMYLLIAVLCLVAMDLITKREWIEKRIQDIIFLLALCVVSLMAFEVMHYGFQQFLVSIYIIFVAIVTANFTSLKRVLIFLSYSFGSLFYYLTSLGFNQAMFRIDYLIFLLFFMSLLFGIMLLRRLNDKKRIKITEGILRQKAAELDLILNNLPFHVAYKDTDNRFIKVNKGVADFLNTTPEELDGKSLYDIFPREFAERYHEEDKEVIKKGSPIVGLVDEVSSLNDQGKVWLKCHKIPQFNQNGEVVGIIVCTEDITAQVDSKKKLYSIEQRFRKIFDFAANGMLIFDNISSPISKSNHSANMLLGYESLDQQKKSLFELIHPEDREVFQNGLDESLAFEGAVFHDEVRMLKSDGGIAFVDLTVNIILEGERKGFIYAILKDITENKESAKRLKIYSRQLEESNQNLKEFAYAASHDLREPLRTVISYIQLLKKKMPSELISKEMNEFMFFIEDASRRMEKLIIALLDYSRVGNNELVIEKVDTSDILVTSCKGLSKMISENEAVIEWDELPKIDADKTQISMLLSNIISNSIKYRKPDVLPHIRINASSNENEYLFSVTDNGIGIKEEYLEQIFAVFRRLHCVNSIPGTGIGLATCKKIVQRHGGTIWANSTFGEGTTFYFSIPLTENSRRLNAVKLDINQSNGAHSSTSNGHQNDTHPKLQVSEEGHPPAAAPSHYPSTEN